MGSGSTFAFDLNGTLVTSDRIVLLGTAAAGDFAFASNVINFTLTDALLNGQTYILFDGTADSQFTGLGFTSGKIYLRPQLLGPLGSICGEQLPELGGRRHRVQRRSRALHVGLDRARPHICRGHAPPQRGALIGIADF